MYNPSTPIFHHNNTNNNHGSNTSDYSTDDSYHHHYHHGASSPINNNNNDDGYHRHTKNRKLYQSLLTLLIITATLSLLVLCTAFLAYVLIKVRRNKHNGDDDNGANLRFIVLGDWGRGGDHNQTLVSDQMARWCRRNNSKNSPNQENNSCHFVLNVGDNFYTNGVTSIHDALWQSSYEQIYSSPELKSIRWYSILGNHDIRLNAQAQMDYTEHSDRWYMPKPFYDVRLVQLNENENRKNDEKNDEKNFGFENLGENEKLSVQLVMTDTSPFVPGYYNHVLVNQTFLNSQHPSLTGQLDWMDQQLAKYRFRDSSTSHQNKLQHNGESSGEQTVVDWKIVAGHHAVYSAGTGHGDTPELVAQYVPLLDKHGVDVYFAGHDHSLQYLRERKAPEEGTGYKKTSYVVSGAGSKTDGIVDKHPKMKFGKAEAGFVGVTLTKRTMKMEFVNYLGETLFQQTIKK